MVEFICISVRRLDVIDLFKIIRYGLFSNKLLLSKEKVIYFING